MFSPEATVQSARGSLRNPRRRQRKDSDGFQQQPRRKRSKLSEDTFHSPTDAHLNGNGSAMMNGHASHGADSSIVLIDMPVREKKAPPKRALKDDTALYLTKTDNYSLKKLPSFPSSLSQGSTPFRAFALPSAGLALALTSTHALAWDYTSLAGPTRVLTLPLPFGLKPSDPIPLGAIVRNGPTNDFGVLAIAPSSGRIIFWENVDSAEARSHFAQRPQGVEGSLKMYSGERISGLVDIEHAGYILSLSSGRLAQLTLRDAQGRPSIATNVLKTPSGSSGSFFSFKGLLGSALHKSIAAVKARPSESKGQMEVITATKNGLFQLWDLSWAGQQVFKSEIDVYSEILAAVQSRTAPESRGHQDAHVLDFALLEEQKTQGAIGLLVLVALTGRDFVDYSLLEVDLSHNSGVVTRAIPIKNFQQAQVPKEPIGTLLLPRPGHTSFILFPRAIVVASLAEPEESPDAQLLFDSGRPNFPYQDAIYLREDRSNQFCGTALEDQTRKDRQAAAVVFVQGFGLVQISALPPATENDDIGRHVVTAKSKLEQATFFSTNSENIFDFSIKSRHTFGQEEVEQAAIEISTGVLSSSYDYFDKVTSSLEEQMRKRALALRTLITHLRAEYPPLSFLTRWRLLWNAERLTAALALWGAYQEGLRDQQARPGAYPEPLLLPHMVKCVNEKYKTKIRPDLGETDPVRQYFLKDITKLEILLPWAWQTLRTFYLNNPSKERPSVLQRLSEANDVMLTAFETAFKFREENVELYGFNPDAFVAGLLKPNEGQDMLPQFWTSTHNIVASVRSLVDVGRNLACESFEKGTQEDLAMKIAKDNPRLVKIGCETHKERFAWALAQNDEKMRETGKSLRDEWNKTVRPDHIYGLVVIGLANEGMNLAEHYRDMRTLASLVWDETRYIEETKENAQSKMEQAECIVKLNRIKERVHRYFDCYGPKWADAFYSKYINENRCGQLFAKEYLNQSALTEFLRADYTRGKLTWINEVCGEKNYDLAHDVLVHVAKKQETNVWCKKVELSMAKLALLCKQQAKPDGGAEPEPQPQDVGKLAATVAQLEYVKIQDRIFERLAPTISGSLDDDSAVQLLMDEYGQGRMAERPAHQQLLQQGFENLIHNRVLEPALLIDVLTLMTYDETRQPTEITQANEFAFALKVLALRWDDMKRTTRTGLFRLIWKRLLIKDDWAEINDTQDMSDSQMEEFLAHTHVGWTFKVILKMIENHSNRVMWPKELNSLLGAGCTNGELCVRFGSEDLRNPIIADNLADDEILQANLEKHRLSDWFMRACEAGQRAYEAEHMPGQLQRGPFDGDDSVSVEGIEEDEAEAATTNGGSNAENTPDVEMEDA